MSDDLVSDIDLQIPRIRSLALATANWGRCGSRRDQYWDNLLSSAEQTLIEPRA
jgi:hypothetical protein